MIKPIELRLLFFLLPLSLVASGLIFGFDLFGSKRIELINGVHMDSNLLVISFTCWTFLVYLSLFIRYFVAKNTHSLLLLILLTLNTVWLIFDVIVAYTSVAAFGFGFLFDISSVPSSGRDFISVIRICAIAFVLLFGLELYLIVQLIRRAFKKTVSA